jgi:hypothetical protein
MKVIYYIFLLHISLLLLASTNFTLVTFLRDDTSFFWNYYTCSSRNGFGFAFVSNYSLPQVLTYIAAYATGLILYGALFFRGFKFLGLLGFVLSLLGLVSFGIEGSHWIYDHHRSLIVSLPGAFVVIWIFLACCIVMRSKSNN